MLNLKEISKMKVNSVKQLFDAKWIGLYSANYTHKGKTSEWVFASRNKDVDASPAEKGDAVVVVASYKKNLFSKRRYIITKEFRVPIRDYEYGFPAGLIDDGEDPIKASIRELKEETGFLVDKIYKVSPPIFSSGGFSDEAVHMVFVSCFGDIRVTPELGDAEDIKTLLLTKKELKALFLNKDAKWGCRPWCLLQGWLG